MVGARPWRSKLAEAFRRKGVMTLEEVREALGGVSEVTARRRLTAFRYRSSYNHNGRYYMLYEEGRCDALGLWSHSGIRFSRDGSLTATARRLVQESQAGHSQRELQDILGVRVQNTVTALVERGELKRERLDGTFVYLHADEETRAAQVEKRHQRLAAVPEVEASFEAVIQILLVLIRHPGCDETSVARRLKGRSPPIGLDAVRWVFRRYELEQKRGLQSSCYVARNIAGGMWSAGIC